jgi:MFS family permease
MLRIIRRFFYNLQAEIIGRNLTQNFRMIFFSRITINSATQLMGLFLPIFLYQFFDLSLWSVVFYYLIIDSLYAGLVIFGCKGIMNRIGIKKSLQLSVLFGAAYYTVFFLINRFVVPGDLLQNISNWIWIIPAIMLSLSFRLSHWIPFHTNIAKLTEKTVRASQLSLMEATMMALGAVMPIVAGLVLDYLGYEVLFLTAIAIYLVSLIPFSLLPTVEEKFVWSWRKTWRKLFSKKMRPSVIAYAGDGAESVAGAIIWPIFIWQLLDGDYFQIGAISSVIILVTIILQMSFGGLLNKLSNRRRLLRYGTALYAIGWVLKALIGSAFQVFLFSTYHNLSRVFSRTSFDALNYDIAADQGHYVDEYTVVREIAILIGKVIMSIFILILLPYLSLRYIFILAALASLAMSLLRQEEINT